ncbi:MAG: hypothetical protein LBB91_09585 [Clostridiales bacterium]|jgi:beta-lactamase regulating signal transducer with metallopeptidase domain|nr:hypothetical protein [Clostridiales bacterium]
MLRFLIIASLSGSIASLALLIFKNKLAAKLGGFWYYLICIFTLLLFLAPLSSLNISYPPSARQNTPIQAEYIPQVAQGILNAPDKEQTELNQEQNMSNQAASTIPYQPQNSRNSGPMTTQEIILLVWLAGFIATLSVYGISYFRFKRKITAGEELENIGNFQVIRNSCIYSPMLIGFIRPKLVLPAVDLSEADYDLAVRHEMAHYRRHDAWLKLLAVIVNAVHWFNPLAYLLVKTLGEACEYACDDAVVREMGTEGRKQYSEMILNLVCQSSPALSSNMAKNKKQLFRRFELILGKSKRNQFSFIVVFLLICGVAFGSIALANEIYPAVNGLWDKGYIEVRNFGDAPPYHTENPVLINGEIFVPLKQILNICGVSDDCCKYEKGKYEKDKVTIEIWTEGMTIQNGDQSTYKEAKYSWYTQLEVGSTNIDINGRFAKLDQAPLTLDGIIYVSYQYFVKLRDYERTYKPSYLSREYGTDKFSGIRLSQYSSFKNEFQTDFMDLSVSPDDRDISFRESNTFATISKTGFRTGFSLYTDYTGINNEEAKGNLEVVLEKVTRVFGKGSDLEGLFTVKLNGEIIAEQEKGYINNHPQPAGVGVSRHDVTEVCVGEDDVFFATVYFNDSLAKWAKENADSYARDVEIKYYNENTVYHNLEPFEIKLDAFFGSDAGAYYYYNQEANYAEVIFLFHHADKEADEKYKYSKYKIVLDDNQVNAIDNDSFSAHFLVYLDGIRIDSFEGILSVVKGSEGKIAELKSLDGRYLIRSKIK